MNATTLLTMPEVSQKVRRSRSMLYADIAAGRFPAPVRTGKRSVAWRASDVEAWLDGLKPTK